MSVRDLMTDEVFSLTEDDELEAVQNLMWEHGIRHVPVVDEDDCVVGLVSQRDLARARDQAEVLLPQSAKADLMKRYKVSDVMTSEVETVEEDEDIRVAAQLMVDQKYGCLPVVVGRRLVGILTEADFVKMMAEGN